MIEFDPIEQLPRSILPRVLTVHGKYQGPSLYRAMWPNGYLATRGFIADYCSYERFDEQHGLIASGRYNMVITPRIAFASERLFGMWRDMIRNADLAWVYDSDDDLWSPDFPDRQVEIFRDMPEELLTRERYEVERQQRLYVLKRVDALTVTTDHLAAIAGNFTDAPVHVLPNLINASAFEAGFRLRRDIQPLTIGWSGTKRQENDLEHVAAAWRIVAENYPDVKFIVQGWHAPILSGAVPLDRLYILRGVNVEEYPAVLRNIDIACCSVSDDPWNLSKSAVKYFEATLAGSACVVSKPLYGQYVQHLKTGMVASDTEQWVQALSVLIENEQLRRNLQQAARGVVIANYSLENHWRGWVAAWARILDDKRKLGGNNHAPEPLAATRAPASAATG